jgi:hypothetical protein
MSEVQQALNELHEESQALCEGLRGFAITSAAFLEGGRFQLHLNGRGAMGDKVLVVSPDVYGDAVVVEEVQIPRGWNPTTSPEKIQQVMDSGRASHRNRFVSRSGDSADEGQFEVYQYMDKLSEETGRETDAAIGINQDGIRYAVDKSNSIVINKIVPGYYSRWVAKPGFENHDICHYCGVSNTGVNEEGNLVSIRNGYDCWSCGCN